MFSLFRAAKWFLVDTELSAPCNHFNLTHIASLAWKYTAQKKKWQGKTEMTGQNMLRLWDSESQNPEHSSETELKPKVGKELIAPLTDFDRKQ